MSGLPNICRGVNHHLKIFLANSRKLTTKLSSFYRKLIQRAKITRMTAVITIHKMKKKKSRIP